MAKSGREIEESGNPVTQQEFTDTLRGAKAIEFTSFHGPDPQVLGALTDAAKAGADVNVTLAGDYFSRTIEPLRKVNDLTTREIRRAGGTVEFNRGDQKPLSTPLHMKTALVTQQDGSEVGFLSQRNWPDDSPERGTTTILKITDPKDLEVLRAGVDQKELTHDNLTSSKVDALAMEADMIGSSRVKHLDVQTESYGFGVVHDALKDRAERGKEDRFMMVKEDVGPRALDALRELHDAGVEVRLSPELGTEKMAVGNKEAWLGSANATTGRPHTIDWGMRTTNEAVLDQLSKHFEETWQRAEPFDPEMEPVRNRAPKQEVSR